VIDRNYFHSVYFREPGGVLFELATDPPGFAIDEPVARLGERLMLPRQYEAHRAQIEAILPPIICPSGVRGHAAREHHRTEDVSGDALGFVHRYIPRPPGRSSRAARRCSSCTGPVGTRRTSFRSAEPCFLVPGC